MKRPLANGSFDSASCASKACVRHDCVNRNPIGKEAIPYWKVKCGRRARHEELDGGFCVALQRMAKIARALERKRHAPAGDGCALTGSRRVRRDMNALVGRRGASGRRARRIIRASIERHSTAARLISLEGAASAGGHALAIDERSTARHALIDARATVTVGDNAVPNAQSTLLSKHNSHGGLFLRRFRNAPDAASATTTFLRQRRSCDGDVSATAAPFAIAAFFAMAMPYAITASFAMVAPSVMATSFVMAASSASRDYAKHSIMNASVSFSFWHKFAVVNDGFFGT